MKPNPLTQLRERLGMTKGAFARFVGKSEPTIEKLEARIPVDFATQLADIAAEHGYRDLSGEFLAIVENRDPDAPTLPPSEANPFADASPSELDLLQGLLEIVRSPNPKSYLQRVLPGLVRAAMAERHAHTKHT